MGTDRYFVNVLSCLSMIFGKIWFRLNSSPPQVLSFPSSPPNSLQHPVFMFTGETHRLTGHVISHDFSSAQPVWHVKFPSSSEQVSSVTSKRANGRQAPVRV